MQRQEGLGSSGGSSSSQRRQQRGGLASLMSVCTLHAPV
jgi:hypothetical protein